MPDDLPAPGTARTAVRKLTASSSVAAIALLLSQAAAEPAPPSNSPHPFILWTSTEAEQLRGLVETNPGAKAQLGRMTQMESGAMGSDSVNVAFYNMFRFNILTDTVAGVTEKTSLLTCLTPAQGTNSVGDPDPVIQALRYDSVHGLLDPTECRFVEEAFRARIQDFLAGTTNAGPNWFCRATWRPSLSWYRPVGIHLMAAALRDEALVARVFESPCGWKRFFDSYVADSRFICEGFEGLGTIAGPMIWYCNALDRIGLARFGWDYKGTGGANMRSLLRMLTDVAYPRTDVPDGMPNWRIVTMGEAKSRGFLGRGVSEQSLVVGCLPDGTGGESWWRTPAYCGIPLATPALWMEWAHRRFPDDGFDYLLAQMRGPPEKTYFPSLYSGIRPIDVASVKPPAPCPSYVANERGFAFLRIDETPSYWEGSSPALAQQFGMCYAGYAHDCFSILGYQAFNRPIYMNAGFGATAAHAVNDQISAGPKISAISRHPWADTVRGHAGVVVDNLQARPVDRGEDGLRKHRIRFASYPAVKFVAGRASGIYPAVFMERAHFLTQEYDLDVFRLTSGMPRRYEWQVHGPGQHQFDAKWTPTTELNGSMLYREAGATQPPGCADKRDGNDLFDVRRMDPGTADWAATVVQSYDGTNIASSKVGKTWYDRGIGVRIAMLGEPATTVFAGRPPGSQDNEFGGATLMVRRDAESTTFAALHEPFAGGLGQHKVVRYSRISESTNGIAVAVIGTPDSRINDRIVLRYGKVVSTPATFSGGGESFTVTDHAWIRIGRKSVDAFGSVHGLAVKVDGSPTLRTNGVETAVSGSEGFLRFGL